MKTKYLVLIMGILLVGCSAPAAATTQELQMITATPVPPSETPTLVSPTATNTLVPPTATPALSSSEDSEAWDLVYISDSSGWGVADEYAARIEQDLGVQVEVHDLWTGYLEARAIHNALRGGAGWTSAAKFIVVDPVPYIEEAEVIVVYGNLLCSVSAEHPLKRSCVNELETDPDCQEIAYCGEETFAEFEADLAGIFEEIFAIRGGKPVILRTVDWYIPWGPLETWRACGQEQICMPCYLNWSDAIHRVADEYGVPVAGLMRAFSGPDLSLDMPREFIRDDVHPSDEGAAAIADVLAELGYEPVMPNK
jgi:hypothetical protein